MSLILLILVYLTFPAFILALIISERWDEIRSFLDDKIGKYHTSSSSEVETKTGPERKTCPECGRRMLKRDFLEHYEAQHVPDPETPEEAEETVSNTYSDDFSVGDYVDDYELEREEEEDGIVLQEPTGGNKLKKEKIEKKWSGVLQKLRDGKPVVVKETTHFGGLRGNDILDRFKRDMKRIDHNLDLEFHYDEKKSLIEST